MDNNTKDIVKTEENAPEYIHEGPVYTPPVDIYENNDEILLMTDLPGVKKNDLVINLENGRLSIDAKRTIETFSQKGNSTKTVGYHRLFSVPKGIDVEQVKAELKKGLLTLHMPKRAEIKTRQIEISAE